MKKAANILISTLLLLSIILSFSSCHYLEALLNKNVPTTTPTEQTNPTGHICPPKVEPYYELYWLETYDEVLEAIELLESHGSYFTRSAVFNYESEFIDSKYCYMYPIKNAEPLDEGKSYFDRKIDGGWFMWFGYTEYFSIDEFITQPENLYTPPFSFYISDTMGVSENDELFLITEVEDVNKLSIVGPNGKGMRGEMYYLCYDGVRLLYLDCAEDLPSEIHNELAKSLVIIE